MAQLSMAAMNLASGPKMAPGQDSYPTGELKVYAENDFACDQVVLRVVGSHGQVVKRINREDLEHGSPFTYLKIAAEKLRKEYIRTFKIRPALRMVETDDGLVPREAYDELADDFERERIYTLREFMAGEKIPNHLLEYAEILMYSAKPAIAKEFIETFAFTESEPPPPPLVEWKEPKAKFEPPKWNNFKKFFY